MKKIAIIIIILLLIILVYAIFYISVLKDSIKIDYKVVKIDVKNILAKKISLTLDLKVSNTSSKSIEIKNTYFEVYYLNELVAKTPKESNSLNIKPYARDSLALKGLNIDFFLNNKSISMLTNFLAKKPLNLKIKLRARVWFIPINITTDVIYNDYNSVK